MTYGTRGGALALQAILARARMQQNPIGNKLMAGLGSSLTDPINRGLEQRLRSQLAQQQMDARAAEANKSRQFSALQGSANRQATMDRSAMTQDRMDTRARDARMAQMGQGILDERQATAKYDRDLARGTEQAKFLGAPEGWQGMPGEFRPQRPPSGSQPVSEQDWPRIFGDRPYMPVNVSEAIRLHSAQDKSSGVAQSREEEQGRLATLIPYLRQQGHDIPDGAFGTMAELSDHLDRGLERQKVEQSGQRIEQAGERLGLSRENLDRLIQSARTGSVAARSAASEMGRAFARNLTDPMARRFAERMGLKMSPGEFRKMLNGLGELVGEGDADGGAPTVGDRKTLSSGTVVEWNGTKYVPVSDAE